MMHMTRVIVVQVIVWVLQALVHHEEQLRRRFLTAWRLKTAAVLDDYENMVRLRLNMRM